MSPNESEKIGKVYTSERKKLLSYIRSRVPISKKGLRPVSSFYTCSVYPYIKENPYLNHLNINY